MLRIEGPFRVYIGLVPTGYLAPDAIARAVQDGILYCGLSKKFESLRQNAKILVRPDIPVADYQLGRHAYTHPEIVRATLSSTFALAPRANALIAEHSQHPYPSTRMLHKAHANTEPFRHRGYFEFEHLFPGKVRVLALEESRQLEYQLSKDQILSPDERAQFRRTGFQLVEAPGAKPLALARHRSRNEITASSLYFESDLTVYCPKLKSSTISSGFSGALKLGIEHRDNEPWMAHYISDMLEVCNPDLIVSDGIVAGAGGNQNAQRGHELGVVLISNNAVAHDIVAAQIFNLEIEKVDHIRVAMERGWGPKSAAQIELGGAGIDGVKALSQKTSYWDLGLIEATSFGAKFSATNDEIVFPLEILAGPKDLATDEQSRLVDWLYLLCDSVKDKALLRTWPKASVCVGRFQAYPGQNVVYAIGNGAIEELKKRISSSTFLFKFFGVQIHSAQLKNGKKHILIFVSGTPPSTHRLFYAFSIGSLGRMTSHLFRLPLWLDATLFSISNRIRKAQVNSERVKVMTSRMLKNRWWALTPSEKVIREEWQQSWHQSPKAGSIQLNNPK